MFLSPHRKQHPAHNGRHELKYWRPDKHWYHSFLCASVVQCSRFVLNQMNRISFVHKNNWDDLFGGPNHTWFREDGRGLLSFSNHVSLFDDPLITSNLGTTRYRDVRWIAADHKNFFGSNLKGIIYSAGKCVPIIRGGGLKQPGFDFLVSRLRKGDWVHIFPEGGRTRDSLGRLQLPLKIGIGKLIYEANPVVIPFYHYGMHEVLPIGKAMPQKGKNIHLQFGSAEVVDDTWWQKILGRSGELGSPHDAWQAATNWATEKLQSLEECMHPHARPSVSPAPPSSKDEH